MTEDSELLRQYAENHSEAAFTELVQRRIDLVFSVALRQGGGDVQLAEDVTQQTFIALARKARSLSRHPSLGGWLHRASQYAAIDAVRVQHRRREREQETTAMHESLISAKGSLEWEKLRPVLDRALGELSQPDRDAVSLRFFESRTFGDIGRILRLNEEAARKRVDRALDRLHSRLARIGITSSTAALAVALGNQVNAAAPTSLIAQASLAAVSATTITSGISLGSSLLALMNTTKVTLGVVAALGVAAAIFEAHGLKVRQQALDAMTTQRDDLQARLRRTERSLKAADDDNAKMLNVAARLQASSASLAQTPAVRPTHAEVEARFRQAQQMAKNGDTKGALKEFLWLFDEGMRGESAFGGVRLSYLLSAIAKLGEQDPEALAALRERRDQAQVQAAGPNEPDAMMDLVALNRELGDGSRNVALYDQMTPDDPARRILGNAIYDQLVDSQRYADALQAHPYRIMTLSLSAMMQAQSAMSSRGPGAAEEFQKEVANSTSSNIEVLAGAGDIADAQALAKNLLAYDSSDATRAVLQTHAARAGHPDLLTAAPPAP